MNRLHVAVTGCALAAVFTGCSQNAGESVIPDQATQQAGGSIVIDARDYSFVPERAEAKSTRVTIELRNSGAEQHSLTVYTDDDYDEPVADAVIPAVEPGEAATITFEADSATTLNFRCEIHHEMNGELFVGGTATTPDPSEETPDTPEGTTTTTPTQEN